MSTLRSSSAESSMENDTGVLQKLAHGGRVLKAYISPSPSAYWGTLSHNTVTEDPSNRRPRKSHYPSNTTTTGESDGEEGDPEVWATFNKSFRQVQSVLDRNRLLIQQVNENQQSRVPDSMVKNVSLIQELNGNISKVVHLYSDLNSNFSSMCQQRSKNSTADVRNEGALPY